MVWNVLSHPRFLPVLALLGIASVLGVRACERLHEIVHLDARGQPMSRIRGKPYCRSCEARLVWQGGVRYHCPECGAITVAHMIRLPSGEGISQHVTVGYRRPRRRQRPATRNHCPIRPGQ